MKFCLPCVKQILNLDKSWVGSLISNQVKKIIKFKILYNSYKEKGWANVMKLIKKLYPI